MSTKSIINTRGKKILKKLSDVNRPKQKACMHHQRKIRHKLDIFNKTSSRILTNSSNWKLRPHLINLSSVWLSPFRSFISSLFNFQSFCLYFLSLSVCFCLSLCLSSVCLSVCLSVSLSVSLSYYCLPFPNLDLARDRSTAFIIWKIIFSWDR